MPKSLHLTAVLWAALVLFIAEKACSNSLTTSSQYPVVSSSDTDLLVCYMQTADGRTVNLSNLCGTQPQPQIVINELKSDGDLLMGRVVNKTEKTVRSTRVNYLVLSSNSKVLKNGFTYTKPSTLKPGQSASFKVSVDVGDGRLRTTSVAWDEST